MRNRIKRIIDEKGLHASYFADKIRVSRGTISHILNGRMQEGVRIFTDPSKDTIDKILESFPDISSSWLLRGEGPMYNRDKNFLSNVSSHPVQPDLFGNKNSFESPTSKKPPVVDYPQKTETRQPDNKTNFPVIQDINLLTNNPEKKIEKLIIFYSDNTFMTFVAEK